MRGILVAGGSNPSPEFIKKIIREDDLIVCADRGANYIFNLGIIPDVVMGDFDSISLELLEEWKGKVKVIKFPPEKDATDTELAIEFMEDRCQEIIMMGCTGTRFDHVLGSVFLLKRLYEKGIKGKIVDMNNSIFYVKEGSHKFYREDKKYISFIPMVDSVFSTIGCKYTVNNAEISFGSPLGVSNEMVDSESIYEINRGEGLIILSKD